MRFKLKVPATTANFGAGFDVFGAALRIYNEFDVIAEKRAPGARRAGDSSRLISVDIEAGRGYDAPQSFEGLKKLVKSSVIAAIREFGLGAYISERYSSVAVKMTNNSPLARGLGSSASAITGAVHSVNALAGWRLDKAKLLSLACRLEGHPDNITPAFFGGLCVSTGSGMSFNYVKIEMPEDLKAVLCVPDFGVSTEAARGLLPQRVLLKDAVYNASRTALFVFGITGRRYGLLAEGMRDRLHQPYRKKLIPAFDEVISSALGAGAYGAALSGSGSTIIAICPADIGVCKMAGKAMTGAFMGKRLGSRYIICGFDNEGVSPLPIHGGSASGGKN
jgi:homoserine kinase